MRHSLLLVGVLVAALAAGCAGEDGKDGADGLPGTNGQNGTDGANGARGDDGDDGQNGQNGQDAPWAGTLRIHVVTGDPAVNVVGATIGGVGAAKTTDANGVWSGEVAIGAYTISVVAPNLTPITNMVVGVQAEATTEITVPMVSDGTIPGAAPTFTVPGAMNNVGFGKTIELSIAGLADADTATGNLTISWTKTAGPAVTITNGNTANATVVLADVLTARTYAATGETVGVPTAPGVMAFSPDTAGRYTFTAKVTDPEGHAVTKTVTVTSLAFNSTGGQSVAVNQPVVLRGAAGQASYNWVLTTRPGTSAATLVDATTRFPMFTPDVEGTYVLTEGTTSLKVFAGKWSGINGEDTSACTTCHNDTAAMNPFDTYGATGHADMLHMVLTDPVEDHYAARCMACHVVGYDPTASNGGFDEVLDGWEPLPNGSQENWDRFVNMAGPDAVKLANIQCENCHGTQRGHAQADAKRSSMGAEMCASCHASGSHHDRYFLWEESAHSNTQLAIDEGTSASCARCHSAEGFAAWSDAANATGVFPSTSAGAGTTTITCAACHDPHDATNPGQLRLYGSLPMLPNGVKVDDAGSGALCMACHNTRNAYNGKARSDAVSGAIQDDRDPHAPSQTDVLYGVSAYFVDGVRPSAHLSIEDTCVTCHMQIAPAGAHVSNTNHTFEADETVCAECHSAHVTGGALMAETEKSLVKIEGLLISKGLAVLTAGATVAPNTYSYKITPIDHGDDCTGTAGQTLTVLPRAITEVTTSHGRNAYELEFAAPVAMNFAACNGTPAGVRQMTHVVVQTSKFLKPDDSLIFTNGHTIQKAFWNYLLVEEDKSLGVHNPSFVTEVLDNTIEALSAL